MSRYSLSLWKAELAKGGPLRDEAEKYLHSLVQKMTAHIEQNGTRDGIHLSWPNQETLHRLEIFEVSWTLPPAKHEELADYKVEHGEEGDQWRRHTTHRFFKKSAFFEQS